MTLTLLPLATMAVDTQPFAAVTTGGSPAVETSIMPGSPPSTTECVGMVLRVLVRGQELQVLNAVVRSDAVDVVDNFIGCQFPTEMLFHNATVVERRGATQPIAAKIAVCIDVCAALVLRVLLTCRMRIEKGRTGAATKTTLPVLMSGRKGEKVFATVGANGRNGAFVSHNTSPFNAIIPQMIAWGSGQEAVS